MFDTYLIEESDLPVYLDLIPYILYLVPLIIMFLIFIKLSQYIKSREKIDSELLAVMKSIVNRIEEKEK